MITKIVELTNFLNWGKFMVAHFDREEWQLHSTVDPGSRLLAGRGWSPRHLWVLDLQTGEGAIFFPGGSAQADLESHQIWVCPMFPVFLGWLYKHPEHCSDIRTIPAYLELTDKETNEHSALYGYRRSGPSEKERAEVVRASSTASTRAVPSQDGAPSRRPAKKTRRPA
jgi:hypothetical protein